MSDEVIRELERAVATKGDPSDRLLLAHRLTQAGRRHDALDVLVAGASDAGLRAELAKWPAWSHTEGPGRTRCLDARPLVARPELRWAAQIYPDPDAGGCLLASPLGVVAQCERCVEVLDPATGAVRATLPSRNGDTAALAGEVLVLTGVREGPAREQDTLEARDLHTGRLLGHHDHSLPGPAILVAAGPGRVLSRYWPQETELFQFVTHDRNGFRAATASEAPAWCRLDGRDVWLAVQPEGRVDWVEGDDDVAAADSRDLIELRSVSGGWSVVRSEFDRPPAPGGSVRAAERWNVQVGSRAQVTLTPTIVALTQGTFRDPAPTLLLDRATGQQRGEVPWGISAANPGVLYLADHDVISAYDDDARLLWRLELPPPLDWVERLACAAGRLFGVTFGGEAFGIGPPSPEKPAFAQATMTPASTFEELRARLCEMVAAGIQSARGLVDQHTDGTLEHLVIKLPKTTASSARLMAALERWTSARHVVGHKRLVLVVPACDVPRLRVSAP